MARMIPLYSLSSHAELERLAHAFFEQDGSLPGRELDHWLRAEAEFLEAIHSRQWAAAARPPADRDAPRFS